MPFYLPAHLSILFASVILLVIPSSVFFFNFIYCAFHHCLFFSFSTSLLNISCIFLIHASILILSYWIIFIVTIFEVDSLFPLDLFGLVGFYLAPSSVTDICAISLCLNFCVFVLLSADCRVIVPLAPWWLRLV